MPKSKNIARKTATTLPETIRPGPKFVHQRLAGAYSGSSGFSATDKLLRLLLTTELFKLSTHFQLDQFVASKPMKSELDALVQQLEASATTSRASSVLLDSCLGEEELGLMLLAAKPHLHSNYSKAATTLAGTNEQHEIPAETQVIGTTAKDYVSPTTQGLNEPPAPICLTKRSAGSRSRSLQGSCRKPCINLLHRVSASEPLQPCSRSPTPSA